jgi:hypothetical protein
MPTILIYWKAKDMAAFTAAYLYHRILPENAQSGGEGL